MCNHRQKRPKKNENKVISLTLGAFVVLDTRSYTNSTNERTGFSFLRRYACEHLSNHELLYVYNNRFQNTFSFDCNCISMYRPPIEFQSGMDASLSIKYGNRT